MAIDHAMRPAGRGGAAGGKGRSPVDHPFLLRVA
jgi:hypothetical protein